MVVPCMEPPVILVPLTVPVTVTSCFTTIPLISASLLTVNPELVVNPDTVKSSSIITLPLTVPPVSNALATTQSDCDNKLSLISL